MRDGRDVAFSPFLAPKAPFWRKIYFNDDSIYSWRGHAMTQRAYRTHGHLFNAARWVNSVTLGRAHGAMLGERYLEVRYEALVADPAGGAGAPGRVSRVSRRRRGRWTASDVSSQSVGKWRAAAGAASSTRSGRSIEPTLGAFGYDWDDGGSPAMRCGHALGLEVFADLAGERGCRPGRTPSPGGWGGCSGSETRR